MKKHIFGYVSERELAGNGFALPFENAEKEGRICVKNSVRKERRRWPCWRGSSGAVALFFGALGISLSCNKMNIMLSYISPPRDNVFRFNSIRRGTTATSITLLEFISLATCPFNGLRNFFFFLLGLEVRTASPSDSHRPHHHSGIPYSRTWQLAFFL